MTEAAGSPRRLAVSTLQVFPLSRGRGPKHSGHRTWQGSQPVSRDSADTGPALQGRGLGQHQRSPLEVPRASPTCLP